MSFKYINPGYSDFISDKTSSDVTVTFAQSRSGKAFICFRSSDTLYSDSVIGNLTGIIPIASGTEFWAKADFYIPSKTGSRQSIYFKQNKGSGVNIYLESNFWRLTIGGNYTDYKYNTLDELLNGISLKLDAINTIWLHVLLSNDSSIGYVECKINNNYLGKYFGNTMPSGSTSAGAYLYKYFVLGSSPSNVYFSNIIISDEEISPYEKVIPLAVSNTVTDMATDTGLFVATNASETLLQSVTTSSLANEYGSDAQVTGIALIGNPAYEVDDVIGSLTAITKYNGNVTEHDKFTLLTDSDAMIVSSFSLPTDTTVADLSNYQFGWRSEE